MPSRRKRRIRESMAASHMSYQAVINAVANRGGQTHPLPWLIEKTAIALDQAAKLVDLANEPDTNTWYERRLKHTAHALIGRLAPVVAVLCDRQEAADLPAKWEAVAKSGTAALIAWVDEHGLDEEIGAYVATRPPAPSTPYAAARRDERIDKPAIPRDVDNRASIQVRLLSSCSSWLLRHDEQPATRRLLLWIMLRLEVAEYVDVVTLSHRFLPDEIGASSRETEAAFRALWEAGVVEPVDYLPAPENPDSFHIRVAMLGDNETKYPAPYRPHVFGPSRKERSATSA